VHQVERIGGIGFYKDVHIVFFPGLIPRRRTEYADLKDAVFLGVIPSKVSQDSEQRFFLMIALPRSNPARFERLWR
jgi:hypothetical protein